jgi:hypothetical protein
MLSHILRKHKTHCVKHDKNQNNQPGKQQGIDKKRVFFRYNVKLIRQKLHETAYGEFLFHLKHTAKNDQNKKYHIKEQNCQKQIYCQTKTKIVVHSKQNGK